MFNGLQLFCGFNVVVCQKSVLRQIGFKPNGIFQQVTADFGRGMSLCSPSQQVEHTENKVRKNHDAFDSAAVCLCKNTGAAQPVVSVCSTVAAQRYDVQWQPSV